jgi:HSP90 family molecular chaperone
LPSSPVIGTLRRKGSEVPYRIDPIDEYAVWRFKESDGKTAAGASPLALFSIHQEKKG